MSPATKLYPRWRWSLPARGRSAINTAGQPRICITSTGGSGGKTLLALGLARAWLKQGFVVKPFKKGPDYIDAAWLSAASGMAATNLDPFFMSATELAALFAAGMAGAQIGLIEGNRGLYDGLDESGVCSTAQVARALESPVLLAMDCTKATRTIAALINGLMQFETGLKFAGVVLNRVGSARHETLLRRAIEANCNLKVLGALPRLVKNPLPERHMGLASVSHGLAENRDRLLDDIAAFVAENCDVGAILDRARAAPALMARKSAPAESARTKRVRIGVVRDEALWFYYPENLAALENEGAELKFLSILAAGCEQEAAWRNIDALYMGGGFPEDFAPQISKSPRLALIREYAAAGMPVYAECGGLLVLCRTFRRAGDGWPMAGFFPVDVEWHVRPQGLGYVEAEIMLANPYYPTGMKIRGHEFHYSACHLNAAPETAMRLARGAGLYKKEREFAFDGLLANNVWASYTHIFAPAVPCWARNFTSLAGKFSRR